jgi:hypothetical protein
MAVRGARRSVGSQSWRRLVGANGANPRDAAGRVAKDLQLTAQTVGRIVVILLGGVMVGYLMLDLVHTIALWHSPLMP